MLSSPNDESPANVEAAVSLKEIIKKEKKKTWIENIDSTTLQFAEGMERELGSIPEEGWPLC